jgi:putative hydrolase of the HAD superfamily
VAGAECERSRTAEVGRLDDHEVVLTVDQQRGHCGTAAAGTHAGHPHTKTLAPGAPDTGDPAHDAAAHRLATMIIGFDGDDTLWHSERGFAAAHERYRALLAPYADAAVVDERLLATERSNLEVFGYGVKAFTLSMIEAAVEMSGGCVTASEIIEMIGLGRELLDHPLELLDGVEDVVRELAHEHRLVLVTKGDLLHQEAKISACGLAEHFWLTEVVSEKDVDTYRRLLRRHGIAPDDFVMVGNSLRSDVLPVLELGARAVHVPYEITWEIERVAVDDADLFPTITSLRDLPELVQSWA